MQTIPDDYKWPEPWVAITDESKHLELPALQADLFGAAPIGASLADELRRETCSRHALAGQRCTPVAYNAEDENEFVFLTSSLELPIAVVHLTWEQERLPDFPSVRGFPSLEAFASVKWR